MSEDNRLRWLMWGLEAKGVNEILKNAGKKRKKQLFHTQPGFATMSPWI